MPLIKNIQFGQISGYEVGFKVDTLYEMLNTTIHETNQCWRVTKGGVPSVLLRPKDLDEGDKVIIVFETMITLKPREIASLTAFQKNVKNQLPIRLVRPYTNGGQYSPLFGYRYDGLYKVTEVSHVIDKEKLCNQVFIHLQLLPEQPVFWEREPKKSLATAEELIHKQAENHKESKNEAEPTTMVPEEEPQASSERVVEKRILRLRNRSINLKISP